MKPNAKAIIEGHTDGFAKIVADADTNDLLGVHIIGPHATELIAEGGLARLLESTPDGARDQRSTRTRPSPRSSAKPPTTGLATRFISRPRYRASYLKMGWRLHHPISHGWPTQPRQRFAVVFGVSAVTPSCAANVTPVLPVPVWYPTPVDRQIATK